jgi:hypothetical protein
MSKRSLNIPVPIPFETIVDLPDGGVRVPRTFTAPAAAARPVEEGRRAERLPSTGGGLPSITSQLGKRNGKREAGG